MNEQQQRFEMQQNFLFNQQHLLQPVPYLQQQPPSESGTPTSGRKLPVKTQSSMQKALSNKSQNFQVCQNLRTTQPRFYASHADLYQSKEKLFEYNQPRYYSREPTPLAIITNKNVSEYDKFMHRHALPPVNAQNNMTSSQSRIQPVSSQQHLPTQQQHSATPQPAQIQFQLKKRNEHD